MAKDLPYFKFNVSEWNDGDITLCSLEAQGLFINLCSLYWSQEGNLSVTKSKRRFKDCNTTVWDELTSEGIIRIDADQIIIKFLDEQFLEREKLSQKNRENIQKRWNNTTVIPSNNEPKVLEYNIEERREEEKRGNSARISDDYYQSQPEAFESMKLDDQYIEDCTRTLTGRGWRAAEPIDLVACLKQFLSGKADLTTSKQNVRQHFKNWIIREKLENLQTYSQVFKTSLNGTGSARQTA